MYFTSVNISVATFLPESVVFATERSVRIGSAALLVAFSACADNTAGNPTDDASCDDGV